MRLQPEVPIKGLELWACEWEDAHFNSNEFDQTEINHRPVNYVSVGILLKDDDTGFSTATDISEDGTFRGINFVPAKMISRKWKVGNLPPKRQRANKPKPVSPLDEHHIV